MLKVRHRVFTSGIVTLYDPGEKMVVQDGDSGLLVKTRQTDPVRIGQRVEVTGFATAVDGLAGLDSGQFSILPGEMDADAARDHLRRRDDGVVQQQARSALKGR